MKQNHTLQNSDSTVDNRDSPVHQRKGQEVEDRGGVQPTVQHDGGGFELEDIAGQCGVTWQTVLQEGEHNTKRNKTSMQQQHCARF